MALDIKKASESKYGKDFFLKCLLVGPPGTGKTTGAVTFGDQINHLVIDCDGGREVLFGKKNIDFIPYRVTGEKPLTTKGGVFRKMQSDQREILSLITKGDFPYQVIILDSVTMLYDLGLAHVMELDSQRNAGGTPVSTHWMAQKAACRSYIEAFIDAPIHFVATVHCKASKDELLGKITIDPAITGQDAEWLPAKFREVFACQTKPIKKGEEEFTQFRWRTMPDNQMTYLESSLNTDQKFWGALVEPSFEKLLKKRGIEL